MPLYLYLHLYLYLLLSDRITSLLVSSYLPSSFFLLHPKIIVQKLVILILLSFTSLTNLTGATRLATTVASMVISSDVQKIIPLGVYVSGQQHDGFLEKVVMNQLALIVTVLISVKLKTVYFFHTMIIKLI